MQTQRTARPARNGWAAFGPSEQRRLQPIERPDIALTMYGKLVLSGKIETARGQAFQCTMYVMKGFKVAEARARFGELLDHAERGEDVCIERNGVRFHLKAESGPRDLGPASPFFTAVDPDVMSGNWTWTWGRKGVAFKSRRRTR